MGAMKDELINLEEEVADILIDMKYPGCTWQNVSSRERFDFFETSHKIVMLVIERCAFHLF
jgi:hypothetical protein